MAQTTSLSGAPAFTPSAVPKPQPSAPPCPIEKNVPVFVKCMCSDGPSASFTTMPSSPFTRLMQ